MELASDEPRMPFQLHDLDEFSVGRYTRDVESALLERRHVLGIDFVAMPMALFDQIDTVRFANQ